MLNYTFSAREKILIFVLGTALIVVAWYRFVFSGIQGQISSVEAQSADVQNQITMYSTHSAELKKMREKVEEYKKQGKKPTILPEYDNTQSLMAYLNSLLGATHYSISFEDPGYSKEDGMVHRSGTITFDAATYEQARSIAENIARGPYPCGIDALSIVEKGTSTSGGSSQSGAPVNATLEVTFFETLPEGMQMDAEESSSGGQDLTKLTSWKDS